MNFSVSFLQKEGIFALEILWWELKAWGFKEAMWSIVWHWSLSYKLIKHGFDAGLMFKEISCKVISTMKNQESLVKYFLC